MRNVRLDMKIEIEDIVAFDHIGIESLHRLGEAKQEIALVRFEKEQLFVLPLFQGNHDDGAIVVSCH